MTERGMNLSEAHFYLEELQRMMTQHRGVFTEKFVCANGMAIEALEKQMLKDAQPDIVRCKDCIHFHEDVFGDEIGLGKPYDNLIVGHNGCGRLAPKGDMICVSQDGFCFLAEKRED